MEEMMVGIVDPKVSDIWEDLKLFQIIKIIKVIQVIKASKDRDSGWRNK